MAGLIAARASAAQRRPRRNGSIPRQGRAVPGIDRHAAHHQVVVDVQAIFQTLFSKNDIPWP